jgi:hypothetical protein
MYFVKQKMLLSRFKSTKEALIGKMYLTFLNKN